MMRTATRRWRRRCAGSVVPEPSWAWRVVTPDDAPGLVELVRAAYRSGRGWSSEAHLLEGSRIDLPALQKLIGAGEAGMLVVEEEGRPIACCRLQRGEDGVAHFGMFAVAPERQGRGLGRWLLGQAERVAAEWFGAEMLELSVVAQQAALMAWYERLGFVWTGERRPFPAHPRFARPRVDGLEVAILRKPIGS